MKRRDILIGLTACAIAPLATIARAQAPYPSRTIRLIAPFPPGGTVDILSRTLADELSRQLNQVVIVENRGGAGGTIGADLVSKASPDGYTLLFGAVHHAIAQSVYPKLGYDIRKMTPVGLLGRVNHAVIVTNSLPAKDIQELVALLKASPERYNYATPGAGTMQHLMTELFKSVTDTNMTHVPYRGSGPALVDLISGNTHLMFETMPSALQHVNAGSVRAIAVTANKRAPYLPQVPSIAESGIPDYDAMSWYGLYAPGMTPAPVVERLNQAINSAFKNQSFAEKWIGLGAEPGGGTAEELDALTRSEIDRWATVASDAKIKL